MNFSMRMALGGAMALLVPWTAASAITFTATAATVQSIWLKATAGDTIRLTGTFGRIRLQYKISDKAIILDARHATFTDTLEIARVQGLHVIGGKYDVSSGVSRDAHAVVVGSSDDITFDKAVMLGSSNQAGIGFENATDVEVSNSSFTGFHAGIGVGSVTGGVLTKNKFFAAASDGIDIGDSHNVSATFNSCSGGAPIAGAHPDCIQMWSTAGHPVQSDNTVSDNWATGPTQGFTSFGSGGGGLRLSILRNKVYTSYAQGIACYDCVDSNISFNSVRTIAGAASLTNIHVVGGSDNTVVGNVIDTRFNRPAPRMASLDVATITEPETWALLVAGFGLVGLAARRRGRGMAAASGR